MVVDRETQRRLRREVAADTRERHRRCDGDLGSCRHATDEVARGAPSSGARQRLGVVLLVEPLDSDGRGDGDVRAAFHGDAPTEHDVAVDHGRHGGEVVAVETPHLFVDTGCNREVAGLLGTHGELLGDDMVVVEAGEASHRARSASAPVGQAEPLVDHFAALQHQGHR